MTGEAAQYLALRLGERAAFCPANPALLGALARAAGWPVTPGQAQRIAARWRPWRAHAAAQLWLGATQLPRNPAGPDGGRVAAAGPGRPGRLGCRRMPGSSGTGRRPGRGEAGLGAARHEGQQDQILNIMLETEYRIS